MDNCHQMDDDDMLKDLFENFEGETLFNFCIQFLLVFVPIY